MTVNMGFYISWILVGGITTLVGTLVGFMYNSQNANIQNVVTEVKELRSDQQDFREEQTTMSTDMKVGFAEMGSVHASMGAIHFELASKIDVNSKAPEACNFNDYECSFEYPRYHPKPAAHSEDKP